MCLYIICVNCTHQYLSCNYCTWFLICSLWFLMSNVVNDGANYDSQKTTMTKAEAETEAL